VTRHSSIPAELRSELEKARLDSLALFRALDQMQLTPKEIPQKLIYQLFELDADCVEALWALDQPLGSFNVHKMVRDTLATLKKLPLARDRFRKKLPNPARPLLGQLESDIRTAINPLEAYNQVPGRDPQSR
jgi:hypothetical protein